jgi:predicted amidophosphoribosyltransferase
MFNENGKKNMLVPKLISKSIRTMLVVVRNVSRTIYVTLSELLYGENKIRNNKNNPEDKNNGIKNKSQQKFDSLSITKPRKNNSTEIRVFASGQFQTEERTKRTQNTPPNIIYALQYDQPEVHACIFYLKYRRDYYSTKILGNLLWDTIIEKVSNNLGHIGSITNWIIAPTPSTSYLSGQKKWDHNQDILKKLKENYSQFGNATNNVNFNFVELFTIANQNNVDIKYGELQNNKKLNRSTRIKSSADKFTMINSAEVERFIKDKKHMDRSEKTGLIIFDDVVTTGSTLLALEKIAMDSKMFGKILLIALAH